MRDTLSGVRGTALRAGRAGRAAALRAARRARQRWRTASPAQRQTVRLTASSAVLGLVVAGAAIAVAGPWDSGQRTAERAWSAAQDRGSGTKHTGEGTEADTPSGAPEVLPAVGPTAPSGSGAGSDGAGEVPPPLPAALADVLQPLLEDGALGGKPLASVVDATSGRELYAAGPDKAAVPASTVKLATAAAALSARGPEHRIETRTVRSGEDRVVLVGGGDPTLDDKGLDALAADTARALGRSGTRKVHLGYDTSRYTGPERHPIGTNENIAPVSALMSEQGRQDGSDHGPAPRSSDPAGDAARTFADKLADHGVKVEGEPSKEKHAPGKGAERLGTHRSAPLSSLVERMLTHSDNDTAEALARQTALAEGRPASFAGGADAVRERLGKLGLPLGGVKLADGSGLDRADKVTPRLLSKLLVKAAEPDDAGLRSVLTGLPVAHFTGTLGERYGDQDEESGAGLVRAKTGTLTGVNTLAGTTVDADGRLLAFAFMSSGATDPQAAEGALDRVASALANCGCRDSPSSG
ncbi:D-alanyl-D-alanine carboxypeptidase/D-alanyl-D-alanine-endopeptidase [Streptomyces sp. ODS28]|uniref:D-alanyl-D-alanine carboxypeptidase/D-alanyl-D-alanine endopeptidase n=1 Tax=Streptomyces sp. ODS28 TaxID=3136688 RepID=UPI0031E780C8